jgi:hypothetical protein
MGRTSITRAVRQRLVDEAIERYIDWREACGAVQHAYEQWSHAPACERALSFAAYRAALDREEAAATLYAGVMTGMAAALRDAAPSGSLR